MKTFRIAVWVGVLILAGVLGFFRWYPLKSGDVALEAPFGVPFTLVSQSGRPITEEALRGKPTALFFGFTNCPEICPTTVYELTGWMNKADPDKTKMQAYFVSIDPDRDTPPMLKTYLSNVTDRITGISGDPAKVKEMARGFKVYFKKVPTDPAQPDGEYTMDHTASVFLLDKQGRFTGTIAYGENPDIAEKKLENLIAKN